MFQSIVWKRELMPKHEESQPSAAFIVIGDEILSGRTADANINWLANRLHGLGIKLAEVRVVGDERGAIVSAVRALSGAYDLVFTSGGIGPTHDDMTTGCVAEAFGVPVVLDAEADRRLVEHYAGTDIEYNEARRKMAHVPEGAALIDNPISAAPGYIIGNVHVLAGVPSILQAMVDGLGDTLPGGAREHRLSVHTGLGEGTVAAGLGEIQAAHDGISIGSYPWFRPGAYGTVLVVSGLDRKQVEKVASEVLGLIEGHGGEGRIEETLRGGGEGE